MRSQIACMRCRRSKIKCENRGGRPPCDSCRKSDKECVFRLPEETRPQPPKRHDPVAFVKKERDLSLDRRKLKSDDHAIPEQPMEANHVDVLAASILSEDLWDQLLDIFKQHFAPELPFLHFPTIREHLGPRFRAQDTGPPGDDVHLVLLGVLTLTARFHEDLVKYVAAVHVARRKASSQLARADPRLASEYYADALTNALGPLRTAMRVASIERVQALLMLGLYEWGQTLPKTGGLAAWMYVGNAIRMAQFLNLGLGDSATSPNVATLHKTSTPSQSTLGKEVRRRTMFSCFILDRMLACGKERVSIIRTDDLQIQLPCSEDKFDLGQEAVTDFLTSPSRRGRQTTDDSVLGRLVRLVEIWGEISRYSSAGGRLTEQRPPWEETAFSKLRAALGGFEEDLPRTFCFSRSNYFRHENHASAFIILHMLRNVSHIMLHREYVPFIALRSKQPEGPLDKPTFPKDQAPEGFWLNSAVLLFKSAREIVDLIELCQKKNKLPQSTIVVFAVWTAAFVGLYAAHYPWMDTEKHIISYKWKEENDSDIFQRGATGLAYQALVKMSTSLQMAATYAEVLKKMDSYLSKVTEDFKNSSPSDADDNLGVRLGGKGGGYEEWQHMSKELQDFGTLHPTEREQGSQHHGLSARRALPSHPLTGHVDSGEAIGPEERRLPPLAPATAFTAINHATFAPAASDTSKSHDSIPHSQGRCLTSHQPPHHDQESQQQRSLPYERANRLRDVSGISSNLADRGTPHFEIKLEESKRFGDTHDLEILTQNDDTWLRPFSGILRDDNRLLRPSQQVVTYS